MPLFSPKSSLNRRQILQAGCAGALGLSLADVLAARATADGAAGLKARAKSVVLVFLTGAASHLETFDLKPDAPDGIRGEFKPIDTAAPGVQWSEHLPLLAQRAKHAAVVRTLAHRNPAHLMGTHHVLTGMPIPTVPEDAQLDKVASREDWPCYAAALDYLRPRGDGIPSGVTLPTFLLEGPLTWPGQHAGLLGPAHDPWHITQDPNDPAFRVDSLSLPDGFTVDRMNDREALLAQVNRQRDAVDALSSTGAFAGYQQSALNLLTRGEVARAFEIHREDDATRERYGRHAYGQSLLLARRLVQAGVPIVQCNMGHVQTWDNHGAIFTTLKDRLLPPLDRGLSALLDDLAGSGLLDETLVVVTGEFGRTPQVNAGAGRDHWAGCFSALFAGAGVAGGQVIGKSDAIGGAPVTRPYRPNDLAATIYRALGVHAETQIRDCFNRPLRLCDGEAIEALYGTAG